MGAVKKIILLVLVLLALYFAAQQLNILTSLKLDLGQGSALGKLGAIDAGYGVGADLLLPGKPQDLRAYETALRGLQLRTEDEKNVAMLKLELVEMQKGLQEFSGLLTKASGGTACEGSPKLTAAYNSAKAHAQAALAMAKKAGAAEGFGYLGAQGFEKKIGAVVKSLDYSMAAFNYHC